MSRISRKVATSVVIAAWNERLAEDGLPEELDPIPRRHTRSDTHYRFEQDSDTVALDDPPSAPKYKRPGKPVGYDLDGALESAQDLLYTGELKGKQRVAWVGYCARLSYREIAKSLDITVSRLCRELINPLKYRAGIPVFANWKPERRKNRPYGLKYRKSNKKTT